MEQSETVKTSGPPSWFLVWCYERSFKQECEQIKNAIEELVTPLGGELLRFKKAKTYETWATRSEHTDYILVTDGREAKPCVRILAGGCDILPRRMAVWSEDPRQNNRLEKWAMAFNKAGSKVPVKVISVIDQLAAVVRETLDDMSFGEKTSVVPDVPTTTSPRPCTPDGANITTQAASMSAESLDVGIQLREPTSVGQVTAAVPRPHPPLCWNNIDLPFLAQKTAEGVHEAVLKVLAPALSHGLGTMNVEMMLRTSAPAFYED